MRSVSFKCFCPNIFVVFHFPGRSKKTKRREKLLQSFYQQLDFSDDDDFQKPKFEVRSPRSKSREGLDKSRRLSDKTKSVERQSTSRGRQQQASTNRSRERSTGTPLRGQGCRKSPAEERKRGVQSKRKERAALSEKTSEVPQTVGKKLFSRNTPTSTSTRAVHDRDRSKAAVAAHSSVTPAVLVADSEENHCETEPSLGVCTIPSSFVLDTEETDERQTPANHEVVQDSLVLDSVPCEGGSRRKDPSPESVTSVPDSLVPETDESVADRLQCDDTVPDSLPIDWPQRSDRTHKKMTSGLDCLKDADAENLLTNKTKGKKTSKRPEVFNLFADLTSDENDSYVNTFMETFVSDKDRTAQDNQEMSELDGQLYGFLSKHPKQKDSRVLSKKPSELPVQKKNKKTHRKPKDNKKIPGSKLANRTLFGELSFTSDDNVSPKVPNGQESADIRELSEQLEKLMLKPGKLKKRKRHQQKNVAAQRNVTQEEEKDATRTAVRDCNLQVSIPESADEEEDHSQTVRDVSLQVSLKASQNSQDDVFEDAQDLELQISLDEDGAAGRTSRFISEDESPRRQHSLLTNDDSEAGHSPHTVFDTPPEEIAKIKSVKPMSDGTSPNLNLFKTAKQSAQVLKGAKGTTVSQSASFLQGEQSMEADDSNDASGMPVMQQLTEDESEDSWKEDDTVT